MTDDWPQDPIGTVRVEPQRKAIAVRGSADDHDDGMWYVIDTGGPGFSGVPDISSWPVVELQLPGATGVYRRPADSKEQG